ncbi:AAA family ATPase [Romeria aff. gracilis LEGE 07310]|uniref:gluconokinase n=1 Tax=Vasconcelosia minhoensis LEGE 07310 TaxID=915328 RepID=A0A8J7DPY5_9CYAN|nr:AAA family ATPase [Romeria aff. gracilis LEGE 07310]
MLQPDFYPHPVTQPIELMQTHVSYVLLTGDYAYKLKKPVDFGFLDYSTLEKRRHFCYEELRLNRRAAAALYLGVVPIMQLGDRYQLDGSGDTVEYAVKMRQFPQDALLSHQFEQGELTAEKLRSLAEVIAQFHQSAKTNDRIRSYGEIPEIRYSFDENYDQTAEFIGGPQTQQQFDETKAYTDRFFTERQDLFQRRLDQNRIRACHGDLHLNNICEWQGKLLLFDCIEFDNEPFRCVDVMFDIAYIVMDLQAAGRGDLSTIFLNHYVEQTGDWEGLAVLPLYVSRQSYVRAKVTSFMLNDPTVSEAERQRASEKAARYYRLAWAYTQSQSGRLILMSGLSGSGKSTVAQALAPQLEAVHIRSDAVRKHLAGVPLMERGDDRLYTDEMTQKTYYRLLSLGTELALLGYPVILDAKYDRQIQRQSAIAAAHTANLPFTLIHCTAPREVLTARVRQRSGDIADATVEVLASQTEEPFSATVQPSVIAVDTTQPLEPQLAAIVEALTESEP